MITKGSRITFVFLCIVHSCKGIWVTTNLSTDEINKIFTAARDQGRSNAELMYRWTEEGKGDICRNVLISDSIIAAMNIKYVDKTNQSYAHLISQQENGSALLDKHYSLVHSSATTNQKPTDAEHKPKFVPIYPVEPKAVVVGSKSHEIFGFPCLVMINDKFEEMYIADGYLEKTYTILLEMRMFERDSKEETLLVTGFIEIPTERQSIEDQETLEELYFVSLAALLVKTFLCWDEDESLINPILALSEKEKEKLCTLVNDTIYSDFDGWITGVQFRTANFEHGPITFTQLKKDQPKLRAKYQVVRGIECIGTDKQENTRFILVPNWLQRTDTFVLTYSDSDTSNQLSTEAPSCVDQLGVSLSLGKEHQEASSSRKRKLSNLRTRKKISKVSKEGHFSDVPTEHHTTKKTTTVTQKTVCLISHVEGVSFLVNKENGIHIKI